MRSRIWLIGLLLVIVSIIVTLNLFFYQSYQSEMATQINQQQLIIAKTVASSIKDTVEHYKEETLDMAGLIGLRGIDKEGLGEFFRHAFTNLRDDLRTSAALFDVKARVVFSTWEDTSVEDYGREFIIKRLLENPPGVLLDYTEAGGRFLYIWAPVKAGGGLAGYLLVGLSIEDINKRFLLPVKSGQRGYAWMMNGSGTLMFHPKEPGMVGMNINQHDEKCFKCHDSFNAERRILASTDVGSSSYVAPSGEDKLVAFSWIEPLRWVVCVSIPYSEVTASINNSMRLHSMLVISILISTVIGAAVIIVIDRGRSKAEAKARITDRIRQYADELESIVSERTKELSSEKEKLFAIVSSLEAGICIFANDSGCVWMNKVMKEWLSDEKARGFTLDTVYSAEVRVDEICEAVVKDRVVQDIVQVDLGRKRGFFQISLSSFHTPDGSCQLLMLLQDITEMKNAEEKLVQSEKLTALARLSAGVAHEIGNPLTSISSFVQILKGMESDQFKSEALDTISRHITRIVSIVKEMAEFSRTRSEKAGKFDIAELVESTVELVRYDRRSKKMKIEVSVPRGLASVHADGNQLMQVFMNLILNASDAMQEGGTLSIHGRRADGFVELAFEDTGQGIRPEHMDRLFEPFFTTKETGTGLGLSVSYGIVKSLGGDIHVESRPGTGAKFTVKVPADEG